MDSSVTSPRCRLAAARARGEITLLATTLTLEQAQASLPLGDVSLLMVKALAEVPGDVIRVGDMLVLSPGTRGMRLARLELEIAADGRFTAWRQQVIELTDKVPDAARLQPWYTAYNEALRSDYRRQVAARKARQTGESPYVGAATCTACHATAAATSSVCTAFLRRVAFSANR